MTLLGTSEASTKVKWWQGAHLSLGWVLARHLHGLSHLSASAHINMVHLDTHNSQDAKVDFCCYSHERKCFRQSELTWAKDMQWESSSTLATLRDRLCSLRLGNITPSEIKTGDKHRRLTTEGQGKRGWVLPDEGLMLRGDRGPSRNSGSCTCEPLWGGDPKAGKCWRFSSPMCTSGSEDKDKFNKSHPGKPITTRWIKLNILRSDI